MRFIDKLARKTTWRYGACASASPIGNGCAAPARLGSCSAAGVDLPIEPGTFGRWVHAGTERCIHCARRRRWFLDHMLNPAGVVLIDLLEDDRDARREGASDTVGDVPKAVPLLDDEISNLVA